MISAVIDAEGNRTGEALTDNCESKRLKGIAAVTWPSTVVLHDMWRVRLGDCDARQPASQLGITLHGGEIQADALARKA